MGKYSNSRRLTSNVNDSLALPTSSRGTLTNKVLRGRQPTQANVHGMLPLKLKNRTAVCGVRNQDSSCSWWGLMMGVGRRHSGGVMLYFLIWMLVTQEFSFCTTSSGPYRAICSFLNLLVHKNEKKFFYKHYQRKCLVKASELTVKNTTCKINPVSHQELI